MHEEQTTTMNSTDKHADDSSQAANSGSFDPHQHGETHARDVVDVVAHPEGGRLHGTGTAVLHSIQAVPPAIRFLQSWDAQTRRLAYGVGDGKNGVMAYSDGEVKVATNGVSVTRLTREVVERWPNHSGVDTQDLLTRISSTLARYVHFDDKRVYLLVSLWILGTYVYSMFSHYGYLHLHSTKKRSGKTRVLEVSHHLAFEGMPPVNSPTAPAVRELAARGGTNFFDTLERWRAKSAEAFGALMDLLDAGFRKGGIVSKMVQHGKGVWRNETFAVYAPYGMAGIDKGSLSDTALDRAFSIEIARKDHKVHKADYDFDLCEHECKPIREDCYVWGLQNASRLADVYKGTALDRQMRRIALNDRAANIWKPLFAIASLAALDRETITALEQLAQEMGGDPDAAEDARQLEIVAALRKYAVGYPDSTLVASPSELNELLGIEGIEVKQGELNGLLTEWGFEQRSARVDGKSPRYVWSLSESELNRIADEIRGYAALTPGNGDYSDYTESASDSPDIAPVSLLVSETGSVGEHHDAGSAE